MELAGELLLDGREVDPGALAADQTVAEVEYVQEPRPHRPAPPSSPRLEDSIEAGLARDQIAVVKAWLVASAKRLEEITASRGP